MKKLDPRVSTSWFKRSMDSGRDRGEKYSNLKYSAVLFSRENFRNEMCTPRESRSSTDSLLLELIVRALANSRLSYLERRPKVISVARVTKSYVRTDTLIDSRARAVRFTTCSPFNLLRVRRNRSRKHVVPEHFDI